MGCKDNVMAFHPSIATTGLYPTSEAPYLFREWMRKILCDWPFENLCTAHIGVKLGGAYLDVVTLLNNTEPLFTQLSRKHKKKTHSNRKSSDYPMYVITSGFECG